VPSFTSNAQSAEWFFRRAENHEKPLLDASLKFAEQYDVIWQGEGDEKVIYLTFDAGYENGNIAKILNAMKEHNACGAFFILDHVVKCESELVKRMIDEGHLVCNHTQKHADMSKVTDKNEFVSELYGMEELFRQYTGREMAKFYRPPEGKFSDLNLKHASEIGYKTVFWSFVYADWDNNSQLSANKAFEKIISNTHPGMVILLHPTSSTNAEIMPRLLSEWERMGYRFGSLEEFNSNKKAE
jgi:peptidoglycan-N-acetylmuramic acid deacetylase